MHLLQMTYFGFSAVMISVVFTVPSPKHNTARSPSTVGPVYEETSYWLATRYRPLCG